MIERGSRVVVSIYCIETPRMSTPTNDLLAKMKVLQEAYDNAKKDFDDVRKNLHGTSVASWLRSSKLSFGSNLISPTATATKRGRGRPRKVACVVETVDSGNDVNDNNRNRDGNDSLTSTPYSSSETPMSCEEYENDYDDEFNGAVFTFISDGLFIETREGKFYDIHTRELRGWFNPYTQRAEWL